ncbi:MAG TPA: hypothetical protein VHC22_24140 [Pirellulales bacterium]|nr:hypothetical protein [Pirellulales bacterium]
MLENGAGDQDAANDNSLALLAAALIKLSPADRAKLAAMLLQGADVNDGSAPGNRSCRPSTR